jgi:Protein of unknown function (DUF3443)
LRFLALLISLASLVGITACSGGSSTATVTAISISCTPTSLQSGQYSQCTATVTGTGNFINTVTWAASAGTIDSTGLFTAQAVTASTQVTVTAIANQDTSQTATAIITVTPVTAISVSCTPTIIQSLQTSQCNATANGVITSTVNWSSSIGVISISGIFTAPTVPTATTATITATTQVTGVTGTATVTVNVNNTAPIAVDGGPTVNGSSINYPNGAYVTAMVCVPGTTTCSTIDHVLVDTGSVGFRVLGSALGSLNLTPQTSSDGNPMAECYIPPAGYAWGAVALAKVQVSGEIASSVPVEVIAPSNFPAAPAACTALATGGALNTVTALKAKAILGIGVFLQDCGSACATAPQTTTISYFSCPLAGCASLPAAVAQQVSNPVAAFPNDNNGSEIQLPPVVAGGAQTAQGTLIFGIGTQANNGLASASIYGVSTSGQYPGSLLATYNSNAYAGIFSSGADANYFLTPTITSYPACSNSAYYCPSSQQTASVSIAGVNAVTGTVTLTTDNADTLFQSGMFAFSTLGGPAGNRPNPITFGLPFFYGHNVFTALSGATTPGGTGPYVAF